MTIDLPPRLDVCAPPEDLEISVARARLCNFTQLESYSDRNAQGLALLEPRLLLELVSRYSPHEHLRLAFEQDVHTWRYDIETHRLQASASLLRTSFAAALKVIAPSTQFKLVNGARREAKHSACLAPRASIMLGNGSTRLWFPSLPHAEPNFSLALAAARSLRILSVSFILKPFTLRKQDRAALEAARFRAQAKETLNQAERACVEAMGLWLEAERGVTFEIELGSDAPLCADALNTIAAAMFGRADRDTFGAPDLDLRLAAPSGALPLFRFWPTPRDFVTFAQEVPQVEQRPGSITIGVDAVGDHLRIPSIDRMMHTAVWGGSGTGKTTLLTNCVLEDIENGEGVILIDVHGDMADRVVALLPKSREQDLVFFDAGGEALLWRLDLLTTPGVNPLLERSRLTNMFLGFFRQQYAAIPEAMGPAFEQYFSNAFNLLLSARNEEDRSLIKFDDILLDARFRTKLLRECDDPKVRQFWEENAERVTGEHELANMAPYITNKMTQFTQNPLTAAAISGDKPRLDLRIAMDTRKIVIVRLPKGQIGEFDARFLGALFLMSLAQAALGRANIREKDRIPFRVYIDEFADLANASAARMLAECRKYGLSLMLANQSLGQLNGDKFNPACVGQAMLANCGSFILFRLGLGDALTLTAAIEGVSARELTQLGVGDIIARRLVRGVPQAAERLRGLPPSTPAIDKTRS